MRLFLITVHLMGNLKESFNSDEDGFKSIVAKPHQWFQPCSSVHMVEILKEITSCRDQRDVRIMLHLSLVTRCMCHQRLWSKILKFYVYNSEKLIDMLLQLIPIDSEITVHVTQFSGNLSFIEYHHCLEQYSVSVHHLHQQASPQMQRTNIGRVHKHSMTIIWATWKVDKITADWSTLKSSLEMISDKPQSELVSQTPSAVREHNCLEEITRAISDSHCSSHSRPVHIHSDSCGLVKNTDSVC